ncbi:phosphotransferase [Actinopolymorpha sp. B9G3]|uniref:phosphotransferase family protein n=1 Tax=Actinopolymorpha sp. B9G3 TaxID=3158970 RepID=UPI0032D97509
MKLAGSAGVMGAPPPPDFSRGDYGDRLGDVGFWAPYVREVLRRHGHADGDLQAGFVGTYPTFLAGPVVVKLFGWFRTWRADHDAELAVQQLLRGHPNIPAPALVAHGQLYDHADPWPYLVTTRLAGIAWRDLRPSAVTGTKLAGTVGEIIRQVHDLRVPEAAGLQRDWLGDHRPGTAERQRAWGTLPEHLIDQIPDFLSAPSPHRRLVHADLTEDHLFVDGGQLVGIIDWGDAFVTDPYYELPALHLGAFGGDKRLLGAFLAGYGWPVDDAFCRRAMSMALMHRFDVLPGVRDIARGRDVATLDDLAVLLWDVSADPG